MSRNFSLKSEKLLNNSDRQLDCSNLSVTLKKLCYVPCKGAINWTYALIAIFSFCFVFHVQEFCRMGSLPCLCTVTKQR